MGTAKSDPGSGHSTRLVPGTGGDVLLLSMRQIDKLVAYCTPYEFEDVIAEITGADMVAVDDREALERARRVYKWTRTATRSPRIATRIAPQPSTVRLTRDYDLFLPVFSGTYQLYALAAVPEWRKRCRVAACFITEAWADLLPDYLMELLSEFDHVFLDLQNEAGHDWNRATDDDLARLVQAVRGRAPKRLISISSYDPDADRQARRVRALKLSMLNFHDVPRGEGWGARTAGHVKKFRDALQRAGVDVPVYAGEPDPDDHGHGTREFEQAVRGARDAGAGAWTFHHRDAYRLDDQALARGLDPVNRQVLSALPGWMGR